MSYQPQAGYPAMAGEPPLDHPWYGIGLVDAVKRVFQKYATFDGRASRGEYWWWVLVAGVIGFVLYILTAIAIAIPASNGQSSIGPVGVILIIVTVVFALAVIVPNIAVTVRRLHDAGYSGWFYLLVLIPSVGGIIVLVLCAMPTSPQAPKYGPPIPEGWNPALAGGGYPQQGYPQQNYPQQGGGYAPPPAQGGYGQPPAQGGYPPPPEQGAGYGQPPAQSGYGEPPAQGGYPPPPPAQGGYPSPPPAQGGYPSPPTPEPAGGPEDNPPQTGSSQQ
jgi:uncharacterized membrane protein YhaH (DUF805 family)